MTETPTAQGALARPGLTADIAACVAAEAFAAVLATGMSPRHDAFRATLRCEVYDRLVAIEVAR